MSQHYKFVCRLNSTFQVAQLKKAVQSRRTPVPEQSSTTPLRSPPPEYLPFTTTQTLSMFHLCLGLLLLERTANGFTCLFRQIQILFRTF